MHVVLANSLAGPKSIERLELEILAANLARDSSSSTFSSNSSSQPQAADLPSSLGGCLLAGCGLGSLSLQEAQQVWQRWQDAQSSSDNDADWLPALRGLAPQWRQPPGLKKLNVKQQAGVDQLRGLVQLATAAAMLGQTPKEVVQVSFQCDGTHQR
jgi:hypothetical protein